MYLKNTASYRVKVLDTVFNTHKFTKSVSLSLFAKDLTKLKKKKKHELCQLNYLSLFAKDLTKLKKKKNMSCVN